MITAQEIIILLGELRDEYARSQDFTNEQAIINALWHIEQLSAERKKETKNGLTEWKGAE